MPVSLLYVSRSTLSVPGDEDIVAALVADARARNHALGVTGALLFTHRHFAQILEGGGEAVEELMTSIRRDPRHKDVNTLETVPIEERAFEAWDLAYAGPSSFVDSQIRPFIGRTSGAPADYEVSRLRRLIREFAVG